MNSNLPSSEPFNGFDSVMGRGALTASIAAGDVLSRLVSRVQAKASEAESGSPAQQSSVTLARLYLRQGHVHEARALLQGILQRDPSDANAQGELGRLSSQPRKLRAADLVAGFRREHNRSADNPALRLALLRELLHRLQNLG